MDVEVATELAHVPIDGETLVTWGHLHQNLLSVDVSKQGDGHTSIPSALHFRLIALALDNIFPRVAPEFYRLSSVQTRVKCVTYETGVAAKQHEHSPDLAQSTTQIPVSRSTMLQ